MKIEDLKILSTLFEEPNLTKISKRYNYSQSNLSKIIKRVEEEIGFPLFERKGFHGLQPTAQGLMLAQRIEKIANSWDDTLALAKNLDQQRQDLKITGPGLYMRNIFLPKWFANDLPEKYRLTYVQTRLDQISLAAESSDLDLVITLKPFELEHWVPHQIFTERFAVFSSQARAKSIKDLDLHEKTWIGYRTSNDLLQSFLIQNQISYQQVTAFIDDIESILDLLEKDPNKVSILPEHAIHTHPHLKSWPISSGGTSPLFLMYRSNGHVTKDFVKQLRKLLGAET